ncbi:hypothetical protein BKA83DRAFT_4131594 [Pisolithus microcarpus]|nr:hypothetical protein BKA83DRAFT_4131594 [Pisolithus microcarpus]
MSKVYIVAINGHVPRDMNAGVIKTFSLPWQHAMKHYHYLICQFGAPNGLCSSITESKHIKAVKWPYHHTNYFQALGQMILINQRLEKLTAACTDFKECGSYSRESYDQCHSIEEGQVTVDENNKQMASYEEDSGRESSLLGYLCLHEFWLIHYLDILLDYWALQAPLGQTDPPIPKGDL